MKKRLLLSLALGLAAVTGLIALQTSLSRRILAFAQKEAAGYGLGLQDVHFQSAGLCAGPGLAWIHIRAGLRLRQNSPFARERGFDLEIPRLELRAAGFFPPRLRLRAQEIRLVSRVLAEALPSRSASAERIEHGFFEMKFPCAFLNPRKARRQISAVFHVLLNLVRRGNTPQAFDFHAAAFFEIRGRPFRARILSERKNGVTFLSMPRKDLEKISEALDEGLTREEISILSQRPVLAPQLLQIRNYARHTAYAAGKKDKRIPKDAYRHILWSYLLTREFGESFAVKVTDAHEKDSVLENTEAQEAMDYHNNALGRQYAKKSYAEESILARLMKDPAVIRYSKNLK